MNQFRPNLVVAGCEPYAEDGWDKIQFGNVVLRVVKLQCHHEHSRVKTKGIRALQSAALLRNPISDCTL